MLRAATKIFVDGVMIYLKGNHRTIYLLRTAMSVFLQVQLSIRSMRLFPSPNFSDVLICVYVILAQVYGA